MRIPWQAREYERTCADCGNAWRVPRWAARPRMLGLPTVLTAGARSVNDVVDANAALAEDEAVFRACPECGSVKYRQRPIQ